MHNQRLSRREFLRSGAVAATSTLVAFLPSPVAAQSRPRGPIVLAVPDFVGGTPLERETARNMAQVIASDLERSGHIMLLNTFTIERVHTEFPPRFADWRMLKVQGLVTGRIANHRHKLRSEVRLWDVAEGKQLMGKSYIGAPQRWRQVAHNMADSIYETLAGEPRHFAD